jgi:hypothetical protein
MDRVLKITPCTGSVCQASHWKGGHRKECVRLAKKSWDMVWPAVAACMRDRSDSGSQRHKALIDKAIKLTWTLRRQNAVLHAGLLQTRGDIELSSTRRDDAATRKVSDTIIRGLRGLECLSGNLNDESLYRSFFLAAFTLHQLGVHQDEAEGLFRRHYLDLEARLRTDKAWAGKGLCMWTMSLLESARQRVCRGGQHGALLEEAKQVAARAIPLLGGPWGIHGDSATCEVRLGMQ